MDNKNLLLVEGKSDMIVIRELCKQIGLEVNFDVKHENSITELKKALPVYLKSTNSRQKIWVIIDADRNFEGAWQSIKNILIKTNKYNIDGRMDLPKEGIIIHPKDKYDIIVGVWIMPNNEDIGMLEDFLMHLIPNEDELRKKVVSIVMNIDENRNAYEGVFKNVHKSKAEVYTWLALHDTPGESLSVAIQKKMFKTNIELCHNFKIWLNQLN